MTTRAVEGKQFTDVAWATTQRAFRLLSSTVCRSTTALTAADGRPHLLSFPALRDGLYRVKQGPGWISAMKFLFSHPTLAGLQAATGTAFIWGVHELDSTDAPQPADGTPVTELVCDPLLALTLTAPATAIPFLNTTSGGAKLFAGLGGGERVGLVDAAGIAITADRTRNGGAVVRSTGVLEFDQGSYPEYIVELRNGASTQGMFAMHTNY